MTEMQSALRVALGPKPLTVIQFPSGRWGFVGSVPSALSYVALDGSPLDAETIRLIQKHGPGLFRNRAKTVVFDTKADALAAAAAMGCEVS